MTGDVVARARAALEGVTNGPWEVDGGVVWRVDVEVVPDPNDPSGQTPMQQQVQVKVCDSSPEDAAFIAAARDLVPELVAEVERLRACRPAGGLMQESIAELREALDRYEWWPEDNPLTTTSAVINAARDLLAALAPDVVTSTVDGEVVPERKAIES